MKSKNECKHGSIRSTKFTSMSQRENAVLDMTMIFTILSVGSKGKDFFMVRVTSIKHICNKKHLVPHSCFGSSNSLF